MKRLAALALFVATAAVADEGMWTFNNFPAEQFKKKYGEPPTQAWLDHLRLSAVRLAGGCSASVVSASGLVMTNHHCARGCIEDLSTPKKDFNQLGFFAKAEKDEVKCPDIEINQLVEITDVTKRLQEATRSAADAKFNEVQKAEIARIEEECSKADSDVRCDVVTLYRGGRYDLYKYKRFQDVRLVFAPEEAVAFFGGDPDNFNFPRYDLDVSFLRLYGKDAKPAKVDHFLKWSPKAAAAGDLTFVAGNPGKTSRLMTQAQLEFERDVRLPQTLMRYSELRGLLTQYATRGAEQARHSKNLLFGVENGLKALRGQHAALGDPTFFGAKAAAEKQFRAKVDADAKLKKDFGGAWDGVADGVKKARAYRTEFVALEGSPMSELFSHARVLVRAAEELPKPSAERLREYGAARLPQLKQGLEAKQPIYDEFEETRLTFGLTKLREDLGADHPVVQKVFGQKSPAEIAKALVKGTRLKDPKVRAGLYNDGKDIAAKLDAAKDPMIAFVRSYDAEARAARKRWEEEVDGPLKKSGEVVARALFAVYGTNTYPDATFTLRLSYGQVKGWEEAGRAITPVTSLAGAFTRHTGREPFALPKSWLDAKGKLALETPFNFVTTNDIIGGNSGSPMVNREGDVVGLIFDGNIWSLGGEFGFDENLNRSVAVANTALTEALARIYGAQRLVDELLPPSAAKTGAP